MKQAHKLLVLVALVLALTTMLPSALAYFTTNASAAGTKAVAVGTNTTPTEEMKDRTKVVTITNTGAQAVFVRAQGFAIEALKPDFSENLKSENGWVADGAWFYQNKPLEPGEKVTFEVKLANPEPTSDEIDEFDVTVVYETTPALYTAGGDAYADWSIPLASGN